MVFDDHATRVLVQEFFDDSLIGFVAEGEMEREYALVVPLCGRNRMHPQQIFNEVQGSFEDDCSVKGQQLPSGISVCISSNHPRVNLFGVTFASGARILPLRRLEHLVQLYDGSIVIANHFQTIPRWYGH
jgi:hypothetical protein